ncbi:MAG: riboflavin biosynthesis protein RibF, partial [Marinilabiliales bacterium]
MNIFHQAENLSIKNPVVTIGTFDGVHAGHRIILNSVIRLAKEIGGESTVMTFWPHPRQIIMPDAELNLINSLDEKIKLLEEAGIDNLIIQPFNKELMSLSAAEFVRRYLVQGIAVKHLVFGHDHVFGKNREGTYENLLEFGKKYGFLVDQIDAYSLQGITISSTVIRNYLDNGKVKESSEFLGYPYLLMGKVVNGYKVGRSIGFPTANVQVEHPCKLIPKNGVYAVWVKYNAEIYRGMLNIGYRPTVSQDKKLSIEVHIIDFDHEIYNENIEIYFMYRVRDEKRYPSVE